MSSAIGWRPSREQSSLENADPSAQLVWDVQKIILDFTKCGKVFKVLRQVCKDYCNYFSANYYVWVDRFCDHEASIKKYVKSWRCYVTCAHRLIREAGIYAEELVIDDPNTFLCAILAGGNIFLKENLDDLLADYGMGDLLKFAKWTGRNESLFKEAMVDHDKTCWRLVEKYNLYKLVPHAHGRYLLTDDALSPSEILEAHPEIDCTDSQLLSRVQMTDDLYLYFCDDHDSVVRMSSNPTVTIGMIRKFDKWDWPSLTSNIPDINVIVDNLDLPWEFDDELCRRTDITIPIYHKLAENGHDIGMKGLSSRACLTSKDFFDNLHLKWNFKHLARNYTITYPIVRYIEDLCSKKML